MSSLFGKQPKFKEPKAQLAPPPATEIAAAPVTEVDSGTGNDAAGAVDELRKKYRPSKGIGSTGTGLSV